MKFSEKTFFILLKKKSHEENESISSRLLLIYTYILDDWKLPATIGLVLLEDEISGLLFTIFAKHLRHSAAVLRSK